MNLRYNKHWLETRKKFRVLYANLNMGFLSQLSIMPLLFVAMVFCQHEDYDFEDEYDPEPDEYPSLFHINPSVDYDVSHFSGPLRCAKECFCLPAFPLSMYCDHRKLKVIPAIPIHIQQLYLQYNNIEAVSSQSFANVTTLREINLSHNKINSHMIDYGVFAKLGNLVQLHLQHNELEEFPFPLPNSLEQLLLGFNKISRLPANALQGLVNVTVLDLCNNNLDDSEFKRKQLSNMKNLMQINLCNNRLQNMPPDLPSSLMYLSLENNSISFIPENYFNKLPNITALRLSNNNLQEVPYKVFNLSNLVELNLGHNKLKQTFYIPRSLQHLYIEDNDIESMLIITLIIKRSISFSSTFSAISLLHYCIIFFLSLNPVIQDYTVFSLADARKCLLCCLLEILFPTLFSFGLGKYNLHVKPKSSSIVAGYPGNALTC
uniref:Osteomodulin n=1 Tax=Crocodylus porosus TaxID=8502 RepID=A0A7M4G3L3_CROPO